MPRLRGNDRRSLVVTVSTTNCLNIRDSPYKARLELIYDYHVEYNTSEHGDDDTGPDVVGVGNAISFAVAAALDTCSPDGSPLNAVELVSRHEVLDYGEKVRDGSCSNTLSTNSLQLSPSFHPISP